MAETAIVRLAERGQRLFGALFLGFAAPCLAETPAPTKSGIQHHFRAVQFCARRVRLYRDIVAVLAGWEVISEKPMWDLIKASLTVEFARKRVLQMPAPSLRFGAPRGSRYAIPRRDDSGVIRFAHPAPRFKPLPVREIPPE